MVTKQFSPNDIHRLSRAKYMSINKMITRKKTLIFYQILPTKFFKEMHGYQFWEFVCGYQGLKRVKQRRFWAKKVNRRWGLLPYSMTWHYQICIGKCRYSCRDDLAENLGKITAPRAKKFHFRLSCVAQKHLLSLKSRGNILPGLSDPQNWWSPLSLSPCPTPVKKSFLNSPLLRLMGCVEFTQKSFA